MQNEKILLPTGFVEFFPRMDSLEVFQEMFFVETHSCLKNVKKNPPTKTKYGEFPVVFVDLSLSRVNITIHPEEWQLCNRNGSMSTQNLISQKIWSQKPCLGIQSKTRCPITSETH